MDCRRVSLAASMSLVSLSIKSLTYLLVGVLVSKANLTA